MVTVTFGTALPIIVGCVVVTCCGSVFSKSTVVIEAVALLVLSASSAITAELLASADALALKNAVRSGVTSGVAVGSGVGSTVSSGVAVGVGVGELGGADCPNVRVVTVCDSDTVVLNEVVSVGVVPCILIIMLSASEI